MPSPTNSPRIVPQAPTRKRSLDSVDTAEANKQPRLGVEAMASREEFMAKWPTFLDGLLQPVSLIAALGSAETSSAATASALFPGQCETDEPVSFTAANKHRLQAIVQRAFERVLTADEREDPVMIRRLNGLYGYMTADDSPLWGDVGQSLVRDHVFETLRRYLHALESHDPQSEMRQRALCHFPADEWACVPGTAERLDKALATLDGAENLPKQVMVERVETACKELAGLLPRGQTGNQIHLHSLVKVIVTGKQDTSADFWRLPLQPMNPKFLAMIMDRVLDPNITEADHKAVTAWHNFGEYLANHVFKEGGDGTHGVIPYREYCAEVRENKPLLSLLPEHVREGLDGYGEYQEADDTVRVDVTRLLSDLETNVAAKSLLHSCWEPAVGVDSWTHHDALQSLCGKLFSRHAETRESALRQIFFLTASSAKRPVGGQVVHGVWLYALYLQEMLHGQLACEAAASVAQMGGADPRPVCADLDAYLASRFPHNELAVVIRERFALLDSLKKTDILMKRLSQEIKPIIDNLDQHGLSRRTIPRDRLNRITDALISYAPLTASNPPPDIFLHLIFERLELECEKPSEDGSPDGRFARRCQEYFENFAVTTLLHIDTQPLAAIADYFWHLPIQAGGDNNPRKLLAIKVAQLFIAMPWQDVETILLMHCRDIGENPNSRWVLQVFLQAIIDSNSKDTTVKLDRLNHLFPEYFQEELECGYSEQSDLLSMIHKERIKNDGIGIELLQWLAKRFPNKPLLEAAITDTALLEVMDEHSIAELDSLLPWQQGDSRGDVITRLCQKLANPKLPSKSQMVEILKSIGYCFDVAEESRNLCRDTGTFLMLFGNQRPTSFGNIAHEIARCKSFGDDNNLQKLANKLLSQLLRLGVDFNRRDLVGNTPLHLMAQAGNGMMIRAFQKACEAQQALCVQTVNLSGLYPEDIAAGAGSEEVRAILAKVPKLPAMGGHDMPSGLRVSPGKS